MSGLARRIEALERSAKARASLPCGECGLGHVEDVVTLEWLQERHAGSREPLPATCACACCAPAIDDLATRFARHVERAL